MRLYDEPGPWRKQCPKCKKYIWKGAKICPCSAPGDPYDTISDQLKLAAAMLGLKRPSVVFAIGHPPKIKVGGKVIWDDVIRQLVCHGASQNKFYTPTAIRHWVYNQLGYFDHEANAAIDHFFSTLTQGVCDDLR